LGLNPEHARDLHRFLKVLKPGGRLLISDYCKAPGAPPPAFAKYIDQRGYDLHSVEDYGAMLAAAGFQDVKAEDRTWQVRVQENNAIGTLTCCQPVPNVRKRFAMRNVQQEGWGLRLAGEHTVQLWEWRAQPTAGLCR
jgi:hypothetical protein